jgi:DNA end-binding protein Ku
MLHRECATPIKQKRWCPVHERDVESDELVRGWEVAKGQFVIVEDADLEAIEQHDTSRSIEISRFVRLEEVDPVYFDRTYFLVPAGAEAARRPYVLLLEAMKEAEVAALGRFVLAGKEKLCLIRSMGDALALETLFVHEDVKDHAEIDEAVATAEVKGPELDLAKQIIASLAGTFDPGELRSEYRESLKELLEAKLAGQEIEAPEEAAPTPVVDLMEALRASVAAASTKPAADGTKKKAAPRKRAAASK